MRALLAVTFVLGACATSTMETHDGPDPTPDARVDGAPATDAPPVTDAAPDAAVVADAAVDADTSTDAGPCTISMGHTPALDGVDDVADYPAAQRVTPGATMAATDEVAITWDPTYLYVSVTSQAFLDGSKPLHVYVESGASLAAAAPRAGKEYSGLTPQVGFGAGYVIATRRTNDFGSGPYSAIYAAAGTPAWTTPAYALEPGVHLFTSSDNRTLSVRAPWSELGGCPLAMRVSVHVVNGAAGNEWKDLVPATHTPWLTGGGGFYEVSLTGDPAISGWSLR
ncbi:MAG: hypothetical protein K8M05_21355 [Deltaproteobacteria bacterium]|nr:hypothetical protein [Kofleriaceae bacterium]